MLSLHALPASHTSASTSLMFAWCPEFTLASGISTLLSYQNIRAAEWAGIWVLAVVGHTFGNRMYSTLLVSAKWPWYCELAPKALGDIPAQRTFVTLKCVLNCIPVARVRVSLSG